MGNLPAACFVVRKILRPHMTRRVLLGFNAEAFAEPRQRTGISVADVARLAGVGLSTVHV